MRHQTLKPDQKQIIKLQIRLGDTQGELQGSRLLHTKVQPPEKDHSRLPFICHHKGIFLAERISTRGIGHSEEKRMSANGQSIDPGP